MKLPAQSRMEKVNPLKQSSESSGESSSIAEESALGLLEGKLAEMNDKYLRLSAEFDNYRKRTMRERAELIKSAGEDILSNICLSWIILSVRLQLSKIPEIRKP